MRGHRQGGTHTRWCTQKAVCSHRRSLVNLGATGKAVHIEGGTHTRRCTQRRRRRRCGPPVGRTRGTSPWCPPALIGLAGDREGGSAPTRPAKHHGGGSPLRLLPLSPGPHNVHALPPYTLLDPPRGTEWGGKAEHRLHFRHGPPPPQGKGDAVSRVWALSPPGTTDWAAFGRQVSGAWSVACPPPLPRRTALLPKVSVRGAILYIPPATPTCPPKTPTGRPYPSPAQAGPEGLGCIRHCMGVGGVVSPHNPHGASLSLPGPGRTGGARVYPPLCGGGWCGVPS